MRRFVTLLLFSAVLFSQQTFDHRSAGFTAPFRVMKYEPGGCSVPEYYFNSTTGMLRYCPTANTWANANLSASATDISGVLYGVGGGIGQAQTVTLTPAITALSTGLVVCWTPAAANTLTAPTLAVSGLTAKAITKLGTTALVANDLTATAVACAVYDGTEFQLQNPQAQTGNAATVTSIGSHASTELSDTANLVRGTIAPTWKTYHLVSIATGVNGCSNATGCWQVNGALGANRAAALTQDVVLFQLPSNGFITDASLKTAVACTGATTALSGLGTASNNVIYRAQTYDIAAPVSATNFSDAITTAGRDTTAAENVVASLATTAAVQYVNTLAAGCAVDYSVLWGVLP